MPTIEHNKGGRPRGSGIDDRADLDAVADLMVRDSGLKKTPAIARVVRERHPDHRRQATERRLLRKWNETANERMAAARERRAERTRRSYMPADIAALWAEPEYMSIARQAMELTESSALKYARELAASQAQLRRLVEQFDSPAWRRAQEEALRVQRLIEQADPFRALRGWPGYGG